MLTVKVAGPAPSEIQTYCGAVFPHQQDLAFYQHKLTPRSRNPSIFSDCKAAKLGSAHWPRCDMRFAQRLTAHRRRLCYHQSSPISAPDFLQHHLLDPLLASIDIDNQSLIAVLLGPSCFSRTSRPSTNDCNALRLLSVTSISARRNSRPSASVRLSRMPATVSVPIAVSLQGSCVAALHTRAGKIPTDQFAECIWGRKRFMNRLVGTRRANASIEMAATPRSASMAQIV
jgi:hypothetical protein